ncbi:unnamed protein product [Moneuplotes crassus]|uniref:Uncharacterized protein n=1 Tax=Euplotes crassus TaxID=5936 RepID=A0AAD2D7S9_EUPCR|nr:unnamed protein product [Moneuplotes crassus]
MKLEISSLTVCLHGISDTFIVHVIPAQKCTRSMVIASPSMIHERVFKNPLSIACKLQLMYLLLTRSLFCLLNIFLKYFLIFLKEALNSTSLLCKQLGFLVWKSDLFVRVFLELGHSSVSLGIIVFICSWMLWETSLLGVLSETFFSSCFCCLSCFRSESVELLIDEFREESSIVDRTLDKPEYEVFLRL